MGRVFDVCGNPVDERGPVKAEKHYPIHRPAPKTGRPVDGSPEVLVTGIKVIDLICPFLKGAKGCSAGLTLVRLLSRRGADQQYCQAPRRSVGVRVESASAPEKATTCTKKCQRPG